MAQKINPIALRLGTKSTWFNVGCNSGAVAPGILDKLNLHEEIKIRKIIKGIFLNNNYLTSQIIIKKESNGNLDISFLVYHTDNLDQKGIGRQVSTGSRLYRSKRRLYIESRNLRVKNKILEELKERATQVLLASTLLRYQNNVCQSNEGLSPQNKLDNHCRNIQQSRLGLRLTIREIFKPGLDATIWSEEIGVALLPNLKKSLKGKNRVEIRPKTMPIPYLAKLSSNRRRDTTASSRPRRVEGSANRRPWAM